jgi:hypothetical protein
VMHGCLGASPPQIPHFGILTHLLSFSMSAGTSVTGRNQHFCSASYMDDFFCLFVAFPTENPYQMGYFFMHWIVGNALTEPDSCKKGVNRVPTKTSNCLQGLS